MRWNPALRPLYCCLLAGALGLAALMALTWVLAASTSVQAGNLLPSAGFPFPPSIEHPAISGSPALLPHLGYGLNVRDPANLDPLFAPLGFEWVKLFLWGLKTRMIKPR